MRNKERRKEIDELFQRKHYARFHGPGFVRKMRRLAIYNRKYIEYRLMRIGLLPRRDVKISTFWGREMTVPLLDSNSLSLYAEGMLWGDEYKLTRFFIKSLKDDDIFYDVGASYGFYSALAEEIIRTGEIHIFEPCMDVFPYIARLFGEQDKSIVNNIALGDFSGKTSFFSASGANVSAESTLVEAVAKSEPEKYREEEVEVLTLDAYTKEHKAPTIMKIDVEGAEGLVIRGGFHTLDKTSPLIAMELWRQNHKENSLQVESLKILRDLGYRAHGISEEGEIYVIPIHKLLSGVSQKSNFDNYIFLK